MTYATRETSQHGGQPFELYLFQTETQSWRLTSADRQITHLGQLYEPEAIVRTATQQGQETSSIKVTIPREHAIAQLFVAYIPATPLSLVIFRGHAGELESETVTHFTGQVTAAQFTEDCELTCLPERGVLKRRIPGPKYQKQCNHILYDSGCQVDKNLFKVTGTLTSVSADGLTIQAAAFGTKPDGFFNAGYIEKGAERRMVVSHLGTTLTLFNAMAGLVVGDVIAGFAGCKRDFNDCNTKFDNAPHFFGFEFIPSRNPFDEIQ